MNDVNEKERTDMYGHAYWEIQQLLDKELGTEEELGAGEGIAADVRLALTKAEARGYQRAVDALRAQADAGGEDWPSIAADWLAAARPQEGEDRG